MADRKISEFTVVTGLDVSPGTPDYLAGIDTSAPDSQKNVIITLANFIQNVLQLGTAAQTDGSGIRVVAFPAAANSSGAVGDVAFSSNFLAICLAPDTWYFIPASASRPPI